MGLFGRAFGNVAGGLAGNLIGGFVGGKKGAEIGGRIGSGIGSVAGTELPFKKGGMVKPKKGKKTQRAVLHAGELVVPASMVKHVPKTLKKKIKKHGGRNMK